jgi:hypothetical protein
MTSGFQMAWKMNDQFYSYKMVRFGQEIWKLKGLYKMTTDHSISGLEIEWIIQFPDLKTTNLTFGHKSTI